MSNPGFSNTEDLIFRFGVKFLHPASTAPDMPTVLRLLNWRFHFYSDEGMEPPHIHVDAEDGECKYWLEPIRLARSRNISPTELRRIETAVFEHQDFFKEKWHEFFHH